MLRLILVIATLLVLSCGRGEPQATDSGLPSQTSDTAKAKRAFETLESELVENGGLVVEEVRFDADSIYATLRLGDHVNSLWRQAETTLGRPPELAWATVSARIYRGGELVATHPLRLGQVRNLTPEHPTTTVSLARKGNRAAEHTKMVLPPDGQAECVVLDARVQ